MDKKKLEKVLEKNMEKLTPREYWIMEMRYGFGMFSKQHTLEEIGKQLGLTRERIRQMEAKVLGKLRDIDNSFDKNIL